MEPDEKSTETPKPTEMTTSRLLKEQYREQEAYDPYDIDQASSDPTD